MTRDLTHTLGPLALASGAVLPHVEVAYRTYGERAPDGGNAILVTHGYTAHHGMLQHGSGVVEGSWGALIGPGKPLDTDRWFVVCSNMLGSSYGTTGPGSIHPHTGRRWGVDFPDLCLSDMVTVQRRLLHALGVNRLKAVVGPSYGGFQALQWAVDHPDDVDAVGVIVSAPWLPDGDHMNLPHLMAVLEADPEWQGGRYERPGALVDTLTRWRVDNLVVCGTPAVLAEQGLSPQEAAQRIDVMARQWAQTFDARSLVVLLKAALRFDVRPQLHRIQCPVLHVIANTDRLFPPDAAMNAAMAAIADYRYLELDTPFGHQASGPAHADWSPALRALLESAASRATPAGLGAI